ncbi:ROK family protein [Dermabacteraceae bacterium CCM 9519]
MTRAEIAATLGITPMAAGRIASRLLARGLLVEAPLALKGPGRPGTTLSLSDDWMGVGIDIRAHQSTVSCVSPRGQELLRLNAGTPHVGDPQRTINDLVPVVREAIAQAGRKVSGIGVGLAAALDDDYLRVTHSAYLDWHHVPFQRLLSEQLPYPIALKNIAECAVLANSEQIGPASYRLLMHVQIGVGLGIALTQSRDALSTLAVGGNMGHVFLGDSRRLCNCGRSGCVDTMVGFSAFSAPGRAHGVSGNWSRMDSTTRQILADARRGESWAVSCIQQLQEDLARVITVFTTINGPDKVTLGGYPRMLDKEFFAGLDEKVSANLRAPSPVVYTDIADRASAIGAGLLGLSLVQS